MYLVENKRDGEGGVRTTLLKGLKVFRTNRKIQSSYLHKRHERLQNTQTDKRRKTKKFCIKNKPLCSYRKDTHTHTV